MFFNAFLNKWLRGKEELHTYQRCYWTLNIPLNTTFHTHTGRICLYLYLEDTRAPRLTALYRISWWQQSTILYAQRTQGTNWPGKNVPFAFCFVQIWLWEEDPRQQPTKSVSNTRTEGTCHFLLFKHKHLTNAEDHFILYNEFQYTHIHLGCHPEYLYL